MNNVFSEEAYNEMIGRLFVRFPSFQKVGAGAYKPGIANMEFADQLMGHPHRKYKIIHIAGTNGKGSVSNMLSSVLAARGLKVGLYTSPHILDFRERMRVVMPDQQSDMNLNGDSFELISKEYVWDFVQQWKDTFDHLDMSFFEITTMMALNWFADRNVDVVVLETGLGGRLDSTNIVSPVLTVITNIGLDHCDMLGETLPEIAFEKAGIIKPRVPVVVGESHPETDAVFERKVLYTNLSEPCYMGSRAAVMSLLVFADKVEPALWKRSEEILGMMDLQGEYQKKNLRTVLAALDVLDNSVCALSDSGHVTEGYDRYACIPDALIHTASRTGFRGRWEKLSDDPYVICDIGHNEHGLKYNFSQLDRLVGEGRFSDLIMVYGSVADKDVDAALRLMPENAVCVFTQAQGKRALPADEIRDRYLASCRAKGLLEADVRCVADVKEAVRTAFHIVEKMKEADPDSRPLIYVGGSTYVVSEAVAFIETCA